MSCPVRQPACAVVVACAVMAIACEGPQSALSPAGRDAEQLFELFMVMAIGAGIIWLAVVAIAVYSIRSGESYTQRAANLLVIGGGVALPTVVLAALLVYGLPMLPEVLAPPADGSLRIHVTGKQWWWRVEYISGGAPVETANELRLAVNQRIDLQLASPDVIHSFWVPSLAGKMDLIPGRVTRLALEPTRTGIFRGACAEYCGASHALMAFAVVVLPPDQFRTWVDAQAQPALAPRDEQAARGQAAFMTHGCSACHTIRGTAASARIGPDLTHVGSRIGLAAGTLPNDAASFARWVSDTDRIKPGAHMPAFRALSRDDLSALAAYLDSLE